MIVAANRVGYARASIAAVLAEAHVSRPTFYEYFEDRDACFLAAVGETQARLLQWIADAVRASTPEMALHAAIGALIDFAAAEPAAARFLTNETMAGGPHALAARDRGIAQIEQVVLERCADLPRRAPVPDFCAAMLVGGVYRLLAARTRRGEPSIAGLREDLLAWLSAYTGPRSCRWRTLTPTAPPPSSPYLPDAPLRAPAPLPRGHARLPREEIIANQRQRILFAVARLAETKGYNATTIADLTKAAGVDLGTYYAIFTGKQEAFMAVYQLGFQDLMAITAGAFFAGSSWPERIWEAGRAFTQFLEMNPTIAHVGFVQAQAVGPAAVQRVEDSHVAFTIFLQEGYQNAKVNPPPSRVALEAIITTIFEIVYHQARASSAPEVSGLLGHMVFLVLAPFMGTKYANDFIDARIVVVA